jgi:hypothetical protein
MNVNRRLEIIEKRIDDGDDCILFLDDRKIDKDAAIIYPKCPRGYKLSDDLHECQTCSIPEKNQKRLRFVDVWPGDKML